MARRLRVEWGESGIVASGVMAQVLVLNNFCVD